MKSNNGYFEHDPAVMAFAYELVNEYVRHEREQDKIVRKATGFVRTKPKTIWKTGGMVEKDDA
jgi:hypothetical protein